ncbi:MAG: hypothetical protein L6300_02610 [Syntrophaceae bacterium]|nr:hypothetical protein [Syntrophaceae bacterium]
MVAYVELFKKIRESLLTAAPSTTKEITQAVKNFFLSEFVSSHTVLCSGGSSREFLTDVFISKFDPLKVVKNKTLNIISDSFQIYMAVESELGGSGGSSPYGVMKNVIQDFIKLLSITSKHKVMVFTSLPYSDEKNHITNRANTLKEIYSRFQPNEAEILLVHLIGTKPVSTQVQAVVNENSVSGFYIASRGIQCIEIKI